jgi:hypothetical protein
MKVPARVAIAVPGAWCTRRPRARIFARSRRASRARLVDHRAHVDARRSGLPIASSPSRRAASRACGRRPPPAGKHAQAPSSAARAVERRDRSRRPPPARQRRRVDDHRVLAAGLGDERHGGPRRPAPASVRWMMRATSVDPVKHDPRTRGSATRLAPTSRPRPGTAAARPRHARRVQDAHRLRAMSGVCSAGLAITDCRPRARRSPAR